MNDLHLDIAGPHAGQPVRLLGAEWGKARAALILVHGRGARAADILNLVDAVETPGFIYLAPEAAGNLWYPNRYNSPLETNEPALTSALSGIAWLVEQLGAAGIGPERVVLCGFSQGACLCAEYAARHARRYGGLGILAGGLIGPADTPRDYPGSLEGTPAYLGCSDPDPYFTAEWIQSSATTLSRLGAAVQAELYPNSGHRINLEMMRAVRRLLENVAVEEGA